MSYLSPVVCWRADVLFISSCLLEGWCLIYLQLFVGGLMSYLCYLCLFVHSGVQRILCCVFVLFVIVLSLVYPMLPVSLDCPFLIAPSFFSKVYLLQISRLRQFSWMNMSLTNKILHIFLVSWYNTYGSDSKYLIKIPVVQNKMEPLLLGVILKRLYFINNKNLFFKKG